MKINNCHIHHIRRLIKLERKTVGKLHVLNSSHNISFILQVCSSMSAAATNASCMTVILERLLVLSNNVTNMVSLCCSLSLGVGPGKN